MSSSNDNITRKISGIVLLLLLALSPKALSQVNILDSAFTFRVGIVKTGNALNLISRQIGYFFTYDSKIIDSEKKIRLSFTNLRLRSALDSLLNNDSLRYSIINKYIIIYKSVPVASVADTVKQWDVKYITGVISDFDTGEPLPFATIGIMSKGKGTVTNNNGEFGLKITRDCLNDSLSVSYLGFYNRLIPVNQALGNNFNIKNKTCKNMT